MTVMGDAFMEELSDRGSIPLRSILEHLKKLMIIHIRIITSFSFYTISSTIFIQPFFSEPVQIHP